jgi:hypothetical protein
VPGFKQMTNKPEHWISNLGKNFTFIKYETLFLYTMSFFWFYCILQMDMSRRPQKDDIYLG